MPSYVVSLDRARLAMLYRYVLLMARLAMVIKWVSVLEEPLCSKQQTAGSQFNCLSFFRVIITEARDLYRCLARPILYVMHAAGNRCSLVLLNPCAPEDLCSRCAARKNKLDYILEHLVTFSRVAIAGADRTGDLHSGYLHCCELIQRNRRTQT